MNVFYDDEDRDAYLELIQDQAESSGLDVPAWRLMSNHVHFIVDAKTKPVIKHETDHMPITRVDPFSTVHLARSDLL